MEWNSARGSYGLDGSVVTGMAVTDDYLGNRTYTLALAQDLTYSDGTPITAYDYAFSILLTAAPEVAAIGGETIASDAIVGVADYKSGASDVISGVRVLGDYSLAVTVSAEYQPFFYELAILDYCPYPIEVIAPGCEVAAVSYTHLDVYKRQTMDRAWHTPTQWSKPCRRAITSSPSRVKSK